MLDSPGVVSLEADDEGDECPEADDKANDHAGVADRTPSIVCHAACFCRVLECRIDEAEENSETHEEAAIDRSSDLKRGDEQREHDDGEDDKKERDDGHDYLPFCECARLTLVLAKILEENRETTYPLSSIFFAL